MLKFAQKKKIWTDLFMGQFEPLDWRAVVENLDRMTQAVDKEVDFPP